MTLQRRSLRAYEDWKGTTHRTLADIIYRLVERLPHGESIPSLNHEETAGRVAIDCSQTMGVYAPHRICELRAVSIGTQPINERGQALAR
jgi:hypothetical protein